MSTAVNGVRFALISKSARKIGDRIDDVSGKQERTSALLKRKCGKPTILPCKSLLVGSFPDEPSARQGARAPFGFAENRFGAIGNAAKKARAF